MSGLVSGKVVIVAGAARGLGAAISRWLAGQGASIILLDILEAEGETLARTLADGGGEAKFISQDVTDAAGWRRSVELAVDRHGRLDGLVNNAAINQRSTVMNADPDLLRRIMDVNLVGPLLGMQAVAPAMQATGGGSIVNIVSGGALVASPSAAYGASKWALRGLSLTAALELGPFGIRVNTVYPGTVDTKVSRGAARPETADITLKAYADTTPLQRLVRPDEVAAVVGYLCSDSSSFVTGSEIAVDGGFTSYVAATSIRTLVDLGGESHIAKEHLGRLT